MRLTSIGVFATLVLLATSAFAGPVALGTISYVENGGFPAYVIAPGADFAVFFGVVDGDGNTQPFITPIPPGSFSNHTMVGGDDLGPGTAPENFPLQTGSLAGPSSGFFDIFFDVFSDAAGDGPIVKHNFDVECLSGPCQSNGLDTNNQYVATFTADTGVRILSFNLHVTMTGVADNVESGNSATHDGTIAIGTDNNGDPFDSSNHVIGTDGNGDPIFGNYSVSIDALTITDNQQGPGPVPEPTTMLLLGTGLVAVARKFRS